MRRGSCKLQGFRKKIQNKVTKNQKVGAKIYEKAGNGNQNYKIGINY